MRLVHTILVASFALSGACGPATTTDDDASANAPADKADTGGEADATGYASAGYLRTVDTFGVRGSTFCTATLIAPRAILTAAHCVADLAETALGEVRFGLGAPAKRTTESALDLDSIAIAPDYDSSFAREHLSAPHHDLAVVLLRDAITTVAPARIVDNLATESLRAAPCVYRSIGYGVTDTKTQAQERRSAVKCYDGATDDGSDLRVRGLAGGSCHGDSGGPLVLTATLDAPSVRIVGVTSRAGDDDPEAVLCGDRSRTYFTSASAHRTFIEAALAALN